MFVFSHYKEYVVYYLEESAHLCISLSLEINGGNSWAVISVTVISVTMTLEWIANLASILHDFLKVGLSCETDL